MCHIFEQDVSRLQQLNQANKRDTSKPLKIDQNENNEVKNKYKKLTFRFAHFDFGNLLKPEYPWQGGPPHSKSTSPFFGNFRSLCSIPSF